MSNINKAVLKVAQANPEFARQLKAELAKQSKPVGAPADYILTSSDLQKIKKAKQTFTALMKEGQESLKDEEPLVAASTGMTPSKGHKVPFWYLKLMDVAIAFQDQGDKKNSKRFMDLDFRVTKMEVTRNTYRNRYEGASLSYSDKSEAGWKAWIGYAKKSLEMIEFQLKTNELLKKLAR